MYKQVFYSYRLNAKQPKLPIFRAKAKRIYLMLAFCSFRVKTYFIRVIGKTPLQSVKIRQCNNWVLEALRTSGKTNSIIVISGTLSPMLYLSKVL